MLTQSLIHQLQHLTHSDKLSAMQFLVESMQHESELSSASHVSYDAWALYDSAQSTVELMTLLEQAESSSES